MATASNPQGPISVVAEPQGQFVYVLDGDGELESFKVASNGAMTASGAALNGIFRGGATGGVGDPFFFAASGTSLVWVDNCTFIAEGGPYIALDACPTTLMGSGPGSNSGSNGGGTAVPQQPPAATFTLQVLVDLQYGGSVTSAPAGIDYNPVTGQNFFNHAFPNGSVVELTAAPPDSSQSYDVKWTGDCSGDYREGVRNHEPGSALLRRVYADFFAVSLSSVALTPLRSGAGIHCAALVFRRRQ